MIVRAVPFLARLVNAVFIACVAALLAVPAVGLVRNAMRNPASLDGLWQSGASAASIAGAVDQFVAANYGWRDRMIHTDARLKALLGGESRRVAYGTEGFLFLKDDDVFSQITGQRLNRAGLERLAGIAQELADDAVRQGRTFLVFVAPNKHTIYRRNLPVWARAEPQRTERALLMEMLRERGIAAVDPSPALRAHVDTAPVYWRGDTHWTQYGMIVGFDAMVKALGLSDWAIGADTVFKGHTPVVRSGDLVRLAGLAESWPDVAPVQVGENPFSADGLKREKLDGHETSAAYMLMPEDPSTASGGPRVMVIGDSFTVGGFGALFMRRAGAYLWAHHRQGQFDRRLIERFKPDIIVLEIVERTVASFRNPSNE